MDNKTKDALKQLQAEIRQLQSVVGSKPEANAGADDLGARKEKTAKDIVVQCEMQYLLPEGNGAVKRLTAGATAAQLARVTNETAAALGYAVASPQKVALLRALLVQESESAAALGAQTGLTTGSLYHHLRELMRAGLIHQTGRNRYILTEQGVRVLLVLLALAVEEK